MKSSITAKEIADKLFVSESWLLRVFKEEVGVTLGKYISDRVLFKAQDRLRYHNMSIREISEDLGYCDRFFPVPSLSVLGFLLQSTEKTYIHKKAEDSLYLSSAFYYFHSSKTELSISDASNL